MRKLILTVALSGLVGCAPAGGLTPEQEMQLQLTTQSLNAVMNYLIALQTEGVLPKAQELTKTELPAK